MTPRAPSCTVKPGGTFRAIGAMLARAFPGPERARLRDVLLLTVKNRVEAPFDDDDGEVVSAIIR